ncbi:transposase [Clostridium sp. ZS2-4]|uniref:transposase n=1 Tax=Clostridium sp. ZS2-4 TaxID=2987703 RepID=UPI00227C86AA|nr:transposase [Clostridium sp. ZS2-4]MCY6355291.1 transposase [Clostridium sp. ZS2-4]
MGDALKEVRKSVCKQLDKESRTKLFKDRYILKRANENVTDEEYLRLLEHFNFCSCANLKRRIIARFAK